MKTLTITIDEETYKQMIDYLIEEHGAFQAARMRSSCIRAALQHYFEYQKTLKTTSRQKEKK